MASQKPTPLPNPKTVDCITVYSRSTMKRDEPRMAQFTAISGKNTPRAE